MPGARCARRRVCEGSVESTRVSQVTPESLGIPARNGFNGFLRALPGDRPSSAKITFRELDASVEASGPHDFAVRLKRSRQKRHPHPASCR